MIGVGFSLREISGLSPESKTNLRFCFNGSEIFMKFEDLKSDYKRLFGGCVADADKSKSIDKIVDVILANREKYRKVQDKSGVPWSVIAVIHSLEGSLNFKTHLHNGDPLSQKTVQVPKGRPDGDPPFTWEDSAADALEFEGMTKWREWTIPGVLFVLERYNGSGYNRRKMPSPYLWSFSNNYKKGKFVKDGIFDPEAISKQCGGAVILQALLKRGVDLGLQDSSSNNSDAPLEWDEVGKLTAQKAVSAAGSKLFDRISQVQQFLLDAGFVTANLRAGFVDGKWGGNTSDALTAFQKSKNLPPTGLMNAATGAKMFPASEPDSSKSILEKGAEGDAVKNLQDSLMRLGYLEKDKVGNGYGKFGPQTEKAVKAFQKHLNLTASGVVGEIERKTLEIIEDGIGRDNPHSEITKAIQNQFVALSYLTQKQVDTGHGTFGPQTETAVKNFQHDNLLQESGIVEAVTFKVLFNQVAAEKKSSDEKSNSDFFVAKDGEHYKVAAEILMTESLQAKVEKLAEIYFAKKKTKLIVTSGYRPPVRQARAMYDKIVSEGSASVRKLYKSKVAVDEILNAYRANQGNRENAVDAMIRVIEKQMNRGLFISNHLLSNASDVRLTTNLAALREAVNQVGGRIIVERNHFHIELH